MSLNYYTQQVTHNDNEAAWRMERIFRMDFRIATGDLTPADMCYWVPDKPKWMRWPTYYRNVDKLKRAQEAYNRTFMTQVGKIMGKGWR